MSSCNNVTGEEEGGERSIVSAAVQNVRRAEQSRQTGRGSRAGEISEDSQVTDHLGGQGSPMPSVTDMIIGD